MLDKNEFRSAIAKIGKSQGDVANDLGMSPTTLSAKVNGGQDFKRGEIEMMALKYCLNAEDVRRIFFSEIGA